MKYAVMGILILGVGVLGWRSFGPSSAPVGGARAEIVMPQLSAAASFGKKAYDDNCAQCHGADTGGTRKGPPLTHDYYNPGHHADGAFLAAIANGVRQHHWRFGDMPPQKQVSREKANTIIRYIREIQQANGILYRPH